MFLFTFEGNIQCANKKVVRLTLATELTVINKIVFTSPEAMVEFSRENNG